MARLLVYLAALLPGISTLSAHDTWLQPSAFKVEPFQAITFDLTSGGRFPVLDFAIMPDRIAVASSRLTGESTALREVGRGPHSLQLSQSFSQEGIVTAWVTLLPRQLELTPQKVNEYFKEIHAGADVRATWSSLGGKLIWRESYTKHAKTFLVVGDAGEDASWGEPTGMRLEIVPVTNPLEVRAGRKASFRLIFEGKPLANAPLGLHQEGQLEARFQTTDATGLATFPIERAGRILIFSTRLDYRADLQMWLSDFSTLTIAARRD